MTAPLAGRWQTDCYFTLRGNNLDSFFSCCTDASGISQPFPYSTSVYLAFSKCDCTCQPNIDVPKCFRVSSKVLKIPSRSPSWHIVWVHRAKLSLVNVATIRNPCAGSMSQHLGALWTHSVKMQQVIQVHTHSRSFVKFNKEEFKDSHFCEGFTTSLIAIPPPCEGNVYRNRPTQQRDISPTKGHCSSYSSDKVLVQVSWQPTTSLMPFTRRHTALLSGEHPVPKPLPPSLSSPTCSFHFTHIQTRPN